MGHKDSCRWFVEPRTPETNQMIAELLLSSGVALEGGGDIVEGARDRQGFRHTCYEIPSELVGRVLDSAAEKRTLRVRFFRRRGDGPLEEWKFSIKLVRERRKRLKELMEL